MKPVVGQMYLLDKVSGPNTLVRYKIVVNRVETHPQRPGMSRVKFKVVEGPCRVDLQRTMSLRMWDDYVKEGRLITKVEVGQQYAVQLPGKLGFCGGKTIEVTGIGARYQYRYISEDIGPEVTHHAAEFQRAVRIGALILINDNSKAIEQQPKKEESMKLRVVDIYAFDTKTDGLSAADRMVAKYEGVITNKRDQDLILDMASKGDFVDELCKHNNVYRIEDDKEQFLTVSDLEIRVVPRAEV